MNVVAALAAAAAVFLVTTRPGSSALPDRLALYLAPRGLGPESGPSRRERPFSALAVRSAVAAAVGAVAGSLLGMSAAEASSLRSVAGMGLAGAGAGFLAVKVSATQRGAARRRSLRQELPTAADAIALHVLAGESVPSAIERFCDEAGGVVAEDLAAVLRRHRSGTTLPEELAAAARAAEHPDAARLYEALAHAHHTGGRLADGLAALAADFRAAIARDLVAEGGRRALATYGPILALQIPVTLLFLMYPTLVGLGDLSTTP